MQNNNLSEQLLEQGWVVATLPNQAALVDLKAFVLENLRNNWFPDIERIEDYHDFVVDDEQHTKIQYEISRPYWNEKLGQRIIGDNLACFREIVGPDISVQKFPYLRIARPGQPKDNIGYHRDTYYGSSPYEISVHIPLMDLAEKGCLQVIPGSHLASDQDYQFTQYDAEDVEKGSVKHQLGFLYSPKQLQPDIQDRLVPVPIKFGQVMIFALSLVHGQENNGGDCTRMSTDVRIVNSLAPIDWSRSVHADYYSMLSQGAATSIAKAYEAANATNREK